MCLKGCVSNSAKMIIEIHSNHIDKEKWDAVVNHDPNGRVYGLSWFLDAVTHGQWKGLVLNDYEAVMPFVTGKKFGIEYCYMPYLVQQVSIYGTCGDQVDFLKALRKKYKFAQISLSISLGVSEKSVFKTSTRNNFVMSLKETYSSLHQRYSGNHKMNLNRFIKSEVTVQSSEDINSLLSLFRDEKKTIFSSKEMRVMLDHLLHIYEVSKRRGLAKLYYAMSPESIVGGAFFLVYNNRMYYLLGATKRKNKKHPSVAYGLLDYVIGQYADSNYLLDFEGSQIASISYFFKGFGAYNQPYSVIEWNDLPFYIKWFKR